MRGFFMLDDTAESLHDLPTLRWEHLSRTEKLGIVTSMSNTDVETWELEAGYYVRLPSDATVVIYLEPLELH